MRRIFIVIAVVIVIGGVAVFGYFYLKSPKVAVIIPTNSVLPVSGQTTEVTTNLTTEGETSNNPVTVSARLVKVSVGPVVPGFSVVDKAGTASSSAETVVTYIERQSGNVFTYGGKSGVLTRISNKTVPGIQSAAWLPSGAVAFVRYLSGGDFATINTYALPANGSDGFFMPLNLAGIAVSSTSVLSLASGVNGSVASLSRIDGSHSATVFSTPLTSLRVSFAGKNQYLAFTKPSASLGGSAFLVNSAGQFARVAGPLNGLVAKASPSGKWVLVSYTSSGIIKMQLVNSLTGEVLPLPVATIADKCVWTADETALYCGVPVDPDTSAKYPDDWYQGAASFSDRIWRIQVAGRYAQFVLDFDSQKNGPLDATSLAIDPLNLTLVFENKNDDSLWSYSL